MARNGRREEPDFYPSECPHTLAQRAWYRAPDRHRVKDTRSIEIPRCHGPFVRAITAKIGRQFWNQSTVTSDSSLQIELVAETDVTASAASRVRPVLFDISNRKHILEHLRFFFLSPSQHCLGVRSYEMSRHLITMRSAFVGRRGRLELEPRCSSVTILDVFVSQCIFTVFCCQWFCVWTVRVANAG